jgi:hypothetical protein
MLWPALVLVTLFLFARARTQVIYNLSYATENSSPTSRMTFPKSTHYLYMSFRQPNHIRKPLSFAASSIMHRRMCHATSFCENSYRTVDVETWVSASPNVHVVVATCNSPRLFQNQLVSTSWTFCLSCAKTLRTEISRRLCHEQSRKHVLLIDVSRLGHLV